MKMTLKNLTPSPDLSGLSAAELLAVIAGFQQQLALKDEALQSKEEAIQRRDAHILLLEELLRLRRIQRFAASSEILDSPNLKVPHPRLLQRAFALVPLLEIAPDIRYPGIRKSVAEIHEELEEPEQVVLYGTRTVDP
jgi:hypothetical protein